MILPGHDIDDDHHVQFTANDSLLAAFDSDMQWLRTLGSCLHNHEALTMEFSFNGQHICLEGNKLTWKLPLSYHELCTTFRQDFITTCYSTTASHLRESELLLPLLLHVGILDARVITKGQQQNKQILVQWSNNFPEEMLFGRTSRSFVLYTPTSTLRTRLFLMGKGVIRPFNSTWTQR